MTIFSVMTNEEIMHFAWVKCYKLTNITYTDILLCFLRMEVIRLHFKDNDLWNYCLIIWYIYVNI